MSGRIPVREVIVVEGRYDKNTLLQIFDAAVVETGGFGINNDAEKLALLRRLAAERGGVMAVLREGVCRNAVYSAHKVFLADKAEELARAGVWGLRLLFTNESERECVEVAKSFLGQCRYRPNRATRGLYMKGV